MIDGDYMKRIWIGVLALLILTLLVGCSRRISVSDSQENYLKYKLALQTVAKEFGLELVEKKDSNINNQETYIDFYLYISESEEIFIRIVNSAIDMQAGVESFSIDYSVDKQSGKTIDISLFVALSNCISQKRVTEEFCSDFLSAPESQYSAEQYGFLKLNGEKIAKCYFFGFSEDWMIFYTLNKDEVETLSFGGITNS